MEGGGVPLPSISSGPAVSQADSGFGTVGTGAFNFKPKAGLIEQIVPWLVIGGVAWLVLK